MSTLEIPIEKPLYLSPLLAVGQDPTGQFLAVIRKVGQPEERDLALMQRAVNLCEMEYLEDPFYVKGKWHCKLKTKEAGDG